MADATRPKVIKSAAAWRAILTPEQFRITREAGTERAFTGPYWNDHRAGLYRCVCCGAPLFRSAAKFESGTGWPRCGARAARRISATSSTTARGLRDCATA
jgi:peptide-methionine (R)-S-oxide reductase